MTRKDADHGRRTSLAWRPEGLLPLVLVLVMGCGGGSDAIATQDAYQALEEGKARFAEGNLEAARALLETAMKTGGLQPDFYCEAVALLGRCEADLGNVEAARAALATLEQGDPDMDRIAALRDLIKQRGG